MKLYPVDRDAFAAALSAATVSTGYSDGCVAGSLAVRLKSETARFLAAALAESLDVRLYELLPTRPDLTRANPPDPDAPVVLCVPAELRYRLRANSDPDHDTAMSLLGILALSLNVEIHRPDCC